MKFDLQLENNDDLEYFKTLFYRNVGIEQMVYDFYTDGVMIRVQINGFEGAQLIKVGFFNYYKQDKSTTLTQFCPAIDKRFSSFDEIQSFYNWNANIMWAEFSHSAGEIEVESACNRILEILNVVYKVCKLKAFT